MRRLAQRRPEVAGKNLANRSRERRAEQDRSVEKSSQLNILLLLTQSLLLSLRASSRSACLFQQTARYVAKRRWASDRALIGKTLPSWSSACCRDGSGPDRLTGGGRLEAVALCLFPTDSMSMLYEPISGLELRNFAGAKLYMALLIGAAEVANRVARSVSADLLFSSPTLHCVFASSLPYFDQR